MSVFLKYQSEEGYIHIPYRDEYKFALGNFSIETRIKAEGPSGDRGGIIAQRKERGKEDSRSFCLRIQPTGDVHFVVSDGVETLEGKIEADRLKDGKGNLIKLLDGGWHFVGAAHHAGRLLVFADGEVFEASNQPGARIRIESKHDLFFGATIEDTIVEPVDFFGGEIEEIRLWSKTLSPKEVADRYNYRLIGTERDLVGYWPLDDDGCGNDTQACDYVRNPNHGLLAGAASYRESEFIEHIGGAYVMAYADLVRNYQLSSDPNAAPQDIGSYQVTVCLCKHDGTPYIGDLDIYAGSSINIKCGGKISQIGPDRPLKALTNGNGQLVLHLPPGDGLANPPLLIHADFMHSHERLFVYPDQMLHHRTQAMDAETLRNPRGGVEPLLHPDQFDKEHAEAVTNTIHEMMGKAIQEEHLDETGGRRHPPAREQSRSPNWHTFPLVHIPGVNAKLGRVASIHQNVDPNGVLDIDPLEGTFSRRLEVYMPADGKNTVEWGGQTLAVGQEKADFWELEFLITKDASGDDHLKPRFKKLEEKEYEERRGRLVPEMATFAAGSIWDWFVNAAKKAVTVVVKAVTQVIEESGLKKIIHTISSIVQLVGEKAREFIIKTVEAAVDFVKGVFQQIGVAISKALDFLRIFFDWEDVKRTKRVFTHLTNVTFDHFVETMKEIRRRETKFFKEAEEKIKEKFDQVKVAVGGEDFARASRNNSPAHRLPGPQMNWMQEHLLEHSKDGRIKQVVNLEPMLADVSGLMEELVTKVFDQGVIASLEDGIQQLKEAIHNPDKALPHLLIAVIDLIEAGVLLTLGIADALLDVALRLVQAAFEGIKNILNAPLEIPLISWLYKEFISGDDLTLLDLMSLVIAVPSTLLYKLMNSNNAPFTDERVEEIEKKKLVDLLPSRSRVAGEGVKTFQVVCLMGFEISNAIAGIIDIAQDVKSAAVLNKGVPNSDFSEVSDTSPLRSAGQNVFQAGKDCTLEILVRLPALFSNIFSAPVKYSKEGLSFQGVMETVQWICSMLFNIAEMLGKLVEVAIKKLYGAGKLPEFMTKWADKAEKAAPYASPVIKLATGILNILLSIGVLIEELARGIKNPLLKLGANIGGSVPSVSKLLGCPAIVQASRGVSVVALVMIDTAGCLASGMLVGVIAGLSDADDLRSIAGQPAELRLKGGLA